MSKIDFIKSQHISGESPADLCSRLNTPIEIPNPEPQGQIIQPPNMVEIRAEMSDAEAFAILETRTYDRLTEALAQNNYEVVRTHVLALHGGGKMTVETLQKVSALFNKTIPDPAWQPTIKTSLAAQAGFVITVGDCDEAIG